MRQSSCQVTFNRASREGGENVNMEHVDEMHENDAKFYMPWPADNDVLPGFSPWWLLHGTRCKSIIVSFHAMKLP